MLKLLPGPGLQPWCGRGTVLSWSHGFLTLPIPLTSSVPVTVFSLPEKFWCSYFLRPYQILSAGFSWSIFLGSVELPSFPGDISHHFLSSKLLTMVVHPIYILNINFSSFLICLFWSKTLSYLLLALSPTWPTSVYKLIHFSFSLTNPRHTCCSPWSYHHAALRAALHCSLLPLVISKHGSHTILDALQSQRTPIPKALLKSLVPVREDGNNPWRMVGLIEHQKLSFKKSSPCFPAGKKLENRDSTLFKPCF